MSDQTLYARCRKLVADMRSAGEFTERLQGSVRSLRPIKVTPGAMRQQNSEPAPEVSAGSQVRLKTANHARFDLLAIVLADVRYDYQQLESIAFDFDIVDGDSRLSQEIRSLVSHMKTISRRVEELSQNVAMS